jgi:hypothetical protein
MAQRSTTQQSGELGACDGTLDSDGSEVVFCKALGAACPDAAQLDNEEIGSHAGVAEWQTRWIQNPVTARL